MNAKKAVNQKAIQTWLLKLHSYMYCFISQKLNFSQSLK